MKHVCFGFVETGLQIMGDIFTKTPPVGFVIRELFPEDVNE